MKNSKNAETFVGIMIGLIILSFISLSIIQIVSLNIEMVDEYQSNIGKKIIEFNTDNIIKDINIDNINIGEEFYIYKNKTNKRYEIFTGALNEGYKYINLIGDKKDDLNDTSEKIFLRTIKLEGKIDINSGIKLNIPTQKIKLYVPKGV